MALYFLIVCMSILEENRMASAPAPMGQMLL